MKSSNISKMKYGILFFLISLTSLNASAQSYLTVDGTYNVPSTGAFLVPSGTLAPTSGFQWRYTFSQPTSAWMQNSFSDSGWSQGRGSFARGGLEPNDATTNINWPWPSGATQSTLWARSSFDIADPALKSSIMFWGRWDDNIRIYINGVLAVDSFPSNPANSQWSADYRYLGLSDAARNTIVKGTNRIAVEVRDNGGGAHLNLGIVKSYSMANLPITGYSKSSSFNGIINQIAKSMSLYGIPGGSISIARNVSGTPDLVASAGIGYMTKALDNPIPRHATFRLASLDKSPARSAIRKLVADGFVTYETPVFPLISNLLTSIGQQPLTGITSSSPINTVTIREILDQKSGIWSDAHGNTGSTIGDLRFIYSKGLESDRGTYRYNNHAHFVLRFLINNLARVKGNFDYNNYVRNELLRNSDDNNFYIAWQNVSNRVHFSNGALNEPWYAVGRNFWQGESGLAYYLAGAASTDAYTKYLVRVADSEPWNGGMQGSQTFSRKITYTDSSSGKTISYALSLFFSGAFDPKDEIVAKLVANINSLPCSAWSTNGACN